MTVLRFLPAAVAIAAVLASCGGDPRPEPTPGADDRIVVAALGDSITAGSPLWDPNDGIRVAIGDETDERSQYEHWAARADPRLDFRNCGVFGERTDQIALLLEDCAAGADAVVIQGGINDIAQGRRPEAAAADLATMIRSAQAMGLGVAVADVLPWNNGPPGAAAEIGRLNGMIRGLARDEDVPVLPFHDTLEDPDRPGRMKPAWTYEGDHPSVAGYRRLGERAFVLPPRAGGGQRRSSAGGSPASPDCICGGQEPNQLSRAPSIVRTAPLKKSPAGEAR